MHPLGADINFVSSHINFTKMNCFIQISSTFLSGEEKRTSGSIFDRLLVCLNEMERTQQKIVGSGRASGTDGFDYSYRMTVDQRYQKVALRKAQLYRLYIAQVACQALGLLWLGLVMLNGREVSKIVFLSMTGGIIAIISGELGRRHTSSMLLKLYIFASSFAMALSVSCGSLGHLSGEFTRDSQQNKDRDSLLVLFDTMETWRIFLGALLQIVTTSATISLLLNMCSKRS